MSGNIYSQLILNLPDIDIALDGVKGKLFQGENHQIVFFDIAPIGEIPAHSHGEQWGVVVDGEMHLTVDGKTKICKKGDWYHIPEGTVHSAVFKTRVFAIDVFADKDRYYPKEIK